MIKEAWQGIKDFFNNLSFYGPYYPRPEVMKVLEDKGYKFKMVVVAMPGVAHFAYNVFTAEGKPLSKKDGTLQKYLDDHNQAVADFEAKRAECAGKPSDKPESPAPR